MISHISSKQIEYDKSLINATQPFIGTWQDLPEAYKDNEYIKTGYRINFRKLRQIARSLFMIHNETVNIWSHLIGAIAFIVFLIYAAIFIESVFPFKQINKYSIHLQNISTIENTTKFLM